MMSFSAKDLLYGFHFSISFSSKCVHYIEPFSCIIRMVDNSEPTKNYVFPLMLTRKSDRYNVCAQLPGKCNDTEKSLVLRLLDVKDEVIFMISIHVAWIKAQRNRLLAKDVDVLSIPTLCGHAECKLTLQRLGSKVCSKPLPNSSFDISKILQHNNLFLTWVKSKSLSMTEDILLLSGPINVPFYVLLYMEMTLDHSSMEMEGYFGNTYVCGWRKESYDVLKFVSKINNKNAFSKFFIWLDLVMCNLRTTYRHKVQYPQCNENRSLIDVVGSRMTLLDYIYSHHMDIFPDLLNPRWPFVAIIRDVNSNIMYITCGLARKKFLVLLVINNSNGCDDGDLMFANVYPFSGNATKSCYALEMLCWRDYEEGTMVCCVVKQKEEEKVLLFTGQSGDILCSGVEIEGMINVWTDCQIRETVRLPMITNAPKTIRPLLCTNSALDLVNGRIDDIKPEKDHLFVPWQIGWTDRYVGEWDRSNAYLKFLLDKPLGFFCALV